jgi:hypothetical protein
MSNTQNNTNDKNDESLFTPTVKGGNVFKAMVFGFLGFMIASWVVRFGLGLLAGLVLLLFGIDISEHKLIEQNILLVNSLLSLTAGIVVFVREYKRVMNPRPKKTVA